MATTPINNNKMTNPLLQPSAAKDGGKAKASDKIDPASLLKTPDIAGAAGKATGATGVNISPGAKRSADERAKATDIARKTPEIREDRVADIRARIAAGTYEVDSGKVADGMMREALIEHLSETTERAER